MRGYGPQCYEKMLDKVRSYGIVVEAVEVPMHAICYLLYGEEEGMPEGAKESADEWMDENNYEMIGLSYGYYEEIWVKHKKLYPEEDYGPDDTDNPFFDSHISRSVASIQSREKSALNASRRRRRRAEISSNSIGKYWIISSKSPNTGAALMTNADGARWALTTRSANQKMPHSTITPGLQSAALVVVTSNQRTFGPTNHTDSRRQKNTPESCGNAMTGEIQTLAMNVE
jgi:hypothetical protein